MEGNRLDRRILLSRLARGQIPRKVKRVRRQLHVILPIADKTGVEPVKASPKEPPGVPPESLSKHSTTHAMVQSTHGMSSA